MKPILFDEEFKVVLAVSISCFVIGILLGIEIGMGI